MLYRKWSPKHDLDNFNLQIVAQPCIQMEMFQQLHGSPLGSHLGQKKTLAKIRERVYWPGIKADVKLFCQECVPCALAKGSPGHRVKLKPMTMGCYNERVALDLCGPFPEAPDGSIYVLVLAEYFSKYILLIPTKSKTAMEAADATVNKYINVFGTPRTLHSDQAAEYNSELFREMCKLLHFHKTRTSPHHPMAGGQVERMNRTMLQMLKTLVCEDRSDWVDFLPFLQMAYNSTPHESTGFSPNLLTFGRELDLPADLLYGSPPRQRNRFMCHYEYVIWLRHSMQRACDLARKNLKQAAVRMKRNFDGK